VAQQLVGTDHQGRPSLSPVLLPRVGFLARVVRHITLAAAQLGRYADSIVQKMSYLFLGKALKDEHEIF